MRSALARTDRYSRGAIAFHWVIAALIILNLLIGLFHESLFEGWKNAIPVHKSIGLTVLVLTLGRIAWRLGHRPPPLPPTVGGFERATARAVEAIFYALMLLMPLTGWVMVSTGRTLRPLNWFGLFDVPYLSLGAGSHGIADTSHMLLGYLFAALVVLHIAAALRHHFLLRDTTLVRMLPEGRRG